MRYHYPYLLNNGSRSGPTATLYSSTPLLSFSISFFPSLLLSSLLSFFLSLLPSLLSGDLGYYERRYIKIQVIIIIILLFYTLQPYSFPPLLAVCAHTCVRTRVCVHVCVSVHVCAQRAFNPRVWVVRVRAQKQPFDKRIKVNKTVIVWLPPPAARTRVCVRNVRSTHVCGLCVCARKNNRSING